MRSLLVLVLVSLVLAEEQILDGYHERLGIPEATRIRAEEERAAAGGAVNRIAGGLGSYAGEHPFFGGLIISMSSGSTSICGSSLVTTTRLLTAAQCWWDGYSQAASILAVLGSTRLFSGGVRVQAISVSSHPQYNPTTHLHDIAVLTIPLVPTTSYIKPIALDAGNLTYVGYTAEAIGFGRTTDSSDITAQQELRDVFLTVISNSECAQSYGAIVTPHHVCTSGAGGRGPCGGDGGGPLILHSSAGGDLLIGVTSFVAARGCESALPAGYTRLSQHNNWVRAQL